MDQDCIFCKIVDSKIPSHKVYEDDKIFIFLDINPVKPGHILMIPKDHYDMMIDTPDELLQYIFVKAKEMMGVLKRAVNADFVVLSVVGTDVAHFHVHLTPRYHNDGLADFWPQGKYQEGEAEDIVEKIKNNL